MIKNILCKQNGGIMDFREINTFIHVADQNSFSKAADISSEPNPRIGFRPKARKNEVPFCFFGQSDLPVYKFIITLICRQVNRITTKITILRLNCRERKRDSIKHKGKKHSPSTAFAP